MRGPNELTPAQEAELERIIREARVAKMRGESQRAGDLMEQAIQVAPESPQVHALIGDDLMERMQYAKAVDAYAQARELAPDNVAIETKHAEAILAQQGMSDPFAIASEGVDSYASGMSAVFLTIIVSGLGHYVLGMKGKGVTFFLTTIGGWIFALLIPQGLERVPNLVRGGPEPNYLVFLPLGIALLSHLWALFDVSAIAKQHKPKRVDHPTPPVDKEF